MVIKSLAINLHSIKYGENGRILKTITEEEGLISVFIRSAGSPRKGGITAFLEPMTRVQICYERKQGQGMATLKELTPYASSELISRSLYSSAIAIFMAEVAKGIVQEEEKDLPLFDLLWNWVERLHITEKSGDIPLLYLISLSNILGIYPDQESLGRYFDQREGIFSDSIPSHSDYLSTEMSQYLRSYLQFEAESGPRPHESQGLKKSDLLVHLLHYFKIHLQGFKEVKSHIILAQSIV